jgi:type VI protein secretion system component VasK
MTKVSINFIFLPIQRTLTNAAMFSSMRYILIGLVSILLAIPAGLPAQQAKGTRKKTEREQKKREKAAMKDYQDALKRHHQRQSKETKAMMRQTKKQAKRTLPVERK